MRTLLAVLLPCLLALPLAIAEPASAAGAADDPVGVWPLAPEPEVVDGFDAPEHPWGSGHRGVDLAGHPGQPVRSALPGRVGFVGQVAGRGVVTVVHGGAAAGTRTTYEPVVASVSVGDRVAAGDVVGRLAVVGSHCFPAACLHWGWLRGETYLDPLRLVGGGPVRLLPLWRETPAGTPAGAHDWSASLTGWLPFVVALPDVGGGLVRRAGGPARRPAGGDRS
jgi:murein DD-endopeptidase MepM/ murein hydrolase activator NlpD